MIWEMNEKELNSYRLTSLEEPTDEMLHAIMQEVAEEVRERSKATHEKLMEQLRQATSAITRESVLK